MRLKFEVQHFSKEKIAGKQHHMGASDFLIQAAIYLSSAIFLVLLFKKLGLGSVVMVALFNSKNVSD